MMLSVIQDYIASNDWMIVNNGFEREWEEATLTLICQEFRGTEENHENPQ
jgi:hypothetical protein